MKTKTRKWMILSLWVVATAFIMAGCSTENMEELEAGASDRKAPDELIDLRSAPASQNQLLAQIKAVTAQYHNFEKALADGYVLDPHCAAHPELGGMGYHAVRFDLVDGVVDPLKPEALVYEPMKNGKYRLVAVEYIVHADSWNNDALPMLGDQVFYDHRAPGSGGPPFPHYQLHVWVWKNNPSGMYSPFNPNVSCEFAD
ncbi:MAG: hypothetical protein R6U64_01970 [Bacteroidales bacterium]